MNQASFYSKNNGLQRNDAIYVITNYFTQIKWKNDENIIDIGCGDGDVTLNLLLPKLPNFRKLVGVDLSEAMIKFAEKSSKTDPRVQFVQMDISKALPLKFHGFFHHVFSFYCLHWIQDQRQVMRNMFALLKPGGDMLLAFLASNPVYDIYENMAKTKKWFPYMKNYKKYVSPYHYSKDPEFEMETLLKNQGFQTHLCKVENRSYVYPSFNILSKAAVAVNPFIQKIPENDVNNFVEDYIGEVRKSKNVVIEKCTNNNEEIIHMNYKLFIVYASKPI